MFNQLITVAMHEYDLEPIFKFELTYMPMLLFKNEMMRKQTNHPFEKLLFVTKMLLEKTILKI